jgi:hypothetical protein
VPSREAIELALDEHAGRMRSALGPGLVVGRTSQRDATGRNTQSGLMSHYASPKKGGATPHHDTPKKGARSAQNEGRDGDAPWTS